MTPIDLYKMTPIEETTELYDLAGYIYNHVEELDIFSYLYSSDVSERNTKVKIKIYKNHCFDGRRIWRLASVWFEDKPVMIIRNAGREGDDFHDRFITDKELYLLMIDYIRSLMPREDSIETVSKFDDIPNLDEFYGHKLSGEFEYY